LVAVIGVKVVRVWGSEYQKGATKREREVRLEKSY
jgi:hypothetical protein